MRIDIELPQSVVIRPRSVVATRRLVEAEIGGSIPPGAANRKSGPRGTNGGYEEGVRYKRRQD